MSYNKETKMYEGFIYKISSSKTKNEYIGQTTKSVHARWSDHLSASKTGNQSLYRGMRKYGTEYFQVELVEMVECNNKDELHMLLNEKEIYYISKFNTFHNGYNETPGGQGRKCGDRIVAYDKDGNYLFEADSASEMSEIVGCDIGVVIKCCNGKTVPKCGMIFRYYGDKFDKYKTCTIHKGAKEIYCFTIDGIFYKKYNSIKEAADDLKINYSVIQQCAKFKRSVNGYYFNTKNEFDYVHNKRYTVAVDIYNAMTKDFIGSFDSIKDALIFIGKDPDKCSHVGINKCINGEYNQAYGYIWTLRGNGLPENLHVNASSVMKPINVYTTDGSFIKTFPSQKIAGDELMINKDGINSCLKGRQKTAFGYRFYYANDPSQPDITKVTNITAQELFDISTQ